MNQYFLYIVLGLVFAACSPFSKEELATQPALKPSDYMFMQRAYPSGKINSKAAIEAAKQRLTQSSREDDVLARMWEFAGPYNIGGRITDIEIPTDNSEVYYVGAASGGVFKTTDAGGTWDPIFDQQASLSIGDIEISKSNTDVVWVGTGEVNAGGGSLAYDGDGVYLSTDGGSTWVNKGLNEVGSISKVAIDPNDNETIYVAAMGPLFENDANRGIYKSTDNGDSWERIFYLSDSTGIIDLIIHPTSSDTLYAAAWERVRRPQYRSYGGETSSVYRSTNGGATWTELTEGLPVAPEEKGRISLALATSNPDVLYARYADAAGSIRGVFRTESAGDSWTEVNSSQLTNVGFHWWFKGLYVDPTDENILYNLDFVVEKSVDGGQSWFTAFPDVHVDQHALAFNPQVAGEIILGNDGGVYKSIDDGESSSKYLNLPITQFYRFYVDPQNPTRIYGGSQDNSTMRTTTGSTDNWRIIYIGDGFQPLVDADNANVIYALYQYGNLAKSTNDGFSFDLVTSGITSTDRKNWDTPVVFDPQSSRTLFYGTQRVWKTTNAANSWTAISPDLTNGGGDGNLIFGTITTLDVSTIDSDIIIAGTDDSNVWITLDGGDNWRQVSETLPNLWTTRVLADRTDSRTIYATFSGYRYAANGSHVFKSTNAGDTWSDIGNGLPDVPVNDIVKDQNGYLYLATDIGVYASGNEGESWTALDMNMPAVVVTDLHIDETSQLLYAATYGRSAYKLDIGGEEEILAASIDASISIYPNPATEEIKISLPKNSEVYFVSLYNNLGSIVLSTEVNQNNTTLDVSRLKAGVYYVKVDQGQKRVFRRVVIK